MASPRIGRPPLFRSRERLTVYLEAGDLRAIQVAARKAGCPAATWARRLLLEAAGRDAPIPQRRAACGGDAVERRGDTPHGKPRRAAKGSALLPTAGTTKSPRVQVERGRAADRGRSGGGASGSGTTVRHRKPGT